MNLLDYLYQHLLPASALGDLTGLAGMPKPSYRLRVQIACDSYFGHHQESTELHFYAKGYVEWAKLLRAGADGHALFRERFLKTWQSLGGGDVDVDKEWQSFLEGTYGLCTRTGLPEDIAAKELANLRLTEGAAGDWLSIFDQSTSLFAPHERPRSSRAKWLGSDTGPGV